MELATQLYIDTSENNEETNYELVEFFDFETIEITETIKNIQEVDVVFTDYTDEFVVPASNINNKIFKHYYSTKLINSFDARIKRKARIFINGVFFKEGYIRLSSAKIKDGYPYSYTLNFFGALSGLSDVIGEDKLSDLDYLKRYSHEFNLSNVFSGLTEGLQYNGTTMEEYSNKSRDIVYPLISAQNKWFYNSSGVSADAEFQEGLSVNIYNNVLGSPDADYGINFRQLKPAIKVANIFEAIDAKYESINIKKDCFVYGSRLNELYLLLHNRKGTLSQGIGDTDLVRETFLVRTSDGRSDFNLGSDPSFEELLPIVTYTRFEGVQQARNMTDITFNVNVTTPSSGDIQYVMTILDGTNVLASQESTSFTDSITYNLQTENLKQWNDLKFQMEANGSVSVYTVSMTLTETYSVRSFSAAISDSAWSDDTKTSDYDSIDASYSFPQNVEVFRQVPDMNIIDFMKGIFKMFNLVAKVDDNTGEIDILPLNDYYVSGQERDITNYVDSYNYDIERLQLYGNINFKYEDGQTFGLLNHNEITQDNFGNLKYPKDEEGGNNNFIFDKGNYNVDVPFERIYFSKLSDENNSAVTDICESWLADESQEPSLTKPVLFFNVPTTINTSTYKFGLRGQASFISKYNRGSNSNSDESLSINFNAEIDEFTGNVNQNSLFSKYYRSYISNMFNKESRNLKIEARLPLSFLFEYTLADRLLINGSPFIINELTSNLNTGKSQLDLITAFSIDVEELVDVTAPSDVTGLALETAFTDRLYVIWNSNTETDLQGYKVYVDGVLYQTYGLVNNAKIIGLQSNTSYEIKVTAYDEAGNESALGSATAINESTGVVSDDVAPSIPQNLRTTLVGSTAIGVEWDASTDNVGVNLYKVYLDGVLQTPSDSNTFYTISGLTANTSYEIRVLAEDSNANQSPQSTPITVTTVNT